jgi:hypothetical protein
MFSIVKMKELLRDYIFRYTQDSYYNLFIHKTLSLDTLLYQCVYSRYRTLAVNTKTLVTDISIHTYKIVSADILYL